MLDLGSTLRVDQHHLGAAGCCGGCGSMSKQLPWLANTGTLVVQYSMVCGTVQYGMVWYGMCVVMGCVSGTVRWSSVVAYLPGLLVLLTDAVITMICCAVVHSVL